MSDLTDVQLRKLLEAYGEDVGPLIPSTRGLWEKRLTHLKLTRKIHKPLPQEIFPSGIVNTFDSHQGENITVNRNVPVNHKKMSSPNSSEESCSSFELDSPERDEPGNSPYPLRAKLNTSPLKKRTDTRIFAIETSNSELRDKRKITHVHDSPVVDRKIPANGKAAANKEPTKSSGEEFSECDEKYFLAENSVRSKRKTIETIARFLWFLIKVGYLVSTVSLLMFLMWNNWRLDDETDGERKVELLE